MILMCPDELKSTKNWDDDDDDDSDDNDDNDEDDQKIRGCFWFALCFQVVAAIYKLMGFNLISLSLLLCLSRWFI